MERGYLLLWLFGFSCGSLLGNFTDFFVVSWNREYTFPFLFFTLFLQSKKFIKIPLLLFGSFFWGASHNAPSPTGHLREVQIMQTNLIPFGMGKLAKSGCRYFYLTGVGNISDYGDSIHLPNESFFPNARNRFSPTLQNASFEFSFLFRFVKGIENKISETPARIQGFIYSVILGNKFRLGEEYLLAFKELGIFHLLVISGLHISFIAFILLKIVFFPFQVLYSFRILSPRMWYSLKPLLKIITLVLVYIYAAAIGFPPSVQRSFLLFSFDQFVKIFAIDCSHIERISWVLVLQSIFFALDIFSVGSILSWLTYLTVFAFVKMKVKSWREILLCQITLCLFMSAVLGQLSVLGIFLNLLVVPLFPFVIVGIFPLLLTELFPRGLISLGFQLQILFLDVVKSIYEGVEALPIFFFDVSHFFVLRVGFLFLALACLLVMLKKPSKERPHKEGEA